MLIRAQQGGLIRGIWDRINGPSINHLFFVDDALLFILSCSGLDDRLISGNFVPCIDWLEASMRLLDKKALEDFIIFLWNSWNSRNNFTFRGKEEGVSVIRDKAFTLSNDFRVHNLSHKPIIPFTPACNNWKKPKRVLQRYMSTLRCQMGEWGTGLSQEMKWGSWLAVAGAVKTWR